LLDQLLAGADPKTAFDADGLLDDSRRRWPNGRLNAEINHHLAAEETGNSRRYHDVRGGIGAARERVTDHVQSSGVAAALVAIELSKTTWLFAIHDPVTDKVSRRRVEGATPARSLS
jgi:hypothetical protein